MAAPMLRDEPVTRATFPESGNDIAWIAERKRVSLDVSESVVKEQLGWVEFENSTHTAALRR